METFFLTAKLVLFVGLEVFVLSAVGAVILSGVGEWVSQYRTPSSPPATA